MPMPFEFLDDDESVADDAFQSVEELEALQFLATPDVCLDELPDEILEKYIDAVGGIRNWMELRSAAITILGDDKNEDAPQKTSANGTYDALDHHEEPSVLPLARVEKPTTPLLQQFVRYAAVGLSTAAATLLLVANLWQPQLVPGRQVGWTDATVEAARQISDESKNEREAKKSSYAQLSTDLEEFERVYFADTTLVSEGLQELAVSCQLLRVRVEEYNLSDGAKDWLRGQCDVWADLAIGKLTEFKKTGQSNPQPTLVAAKNLLAEMRRQLKSEDTPG